MCADKAVCALAKIMGKSERIVFFGGAGVSTESGIPDFRSSDGLYNQKYKYPPEVILSRRFFDEHTAEFYEFYRDKMLPITAKPNGAHNALATLEQSGRLVSVVTQNIDGLHQAAGSRNVRELHGSIHRNYCVACKREYTAEYIQSRKGVPLCTCGNIIKPDVVLYGEPLSSETVNAAVADIKSADLLIIGGTSLTVYPAAGLVEYFAGKNGIVVINKSETHIDSHCSLHIGSAIAKTISLAVDMIK